MGQEFDGADAVRACLQVVAFPSRRRRRPAQHHLHVVHDRVVQRAAPDEGLDLGKEPHAEADVAGHRAGTDEGGPLPCAGDGFIISHRRFALDADGRRPGVGTEPQIDPPADAVAGCGGQQPDKRAGRLDIECLAFCRV